MKKLTSLYCFVFVILGASASFALVKYRADYSYQLPIASKTSLVNVSIYGDLHKLGSESDNTRQLVWFLCDELAQPNQGKTLLLFESKYFYNIDFSASGNRLSDFYSQVQKKIKLSGFTFSGSPQSDEFTTWMPWKLPFAFAHFLTRRKLPKEMADVVLSNEQSYYLRESVVIKSIDPRLELEKNVENTLAVLSDLSKDVKKLVESFAGRIAVSFSPLETKLREYLDESNDGFVEVATISSMVNELWKPDNDIKRVMIIVGTKHLSNLDRDFRNIMGMVRNNLVRFDHDTSISPPEVEVSARTN